MAEVQGTCDARFDGVRRTLAANLDSGADVGASVAVYLQRRAGGRHLGRLRRRDKGRRGNATP